MTYPNSRLLQVDIWMFLAKKSIQLAPGLFAGLGTSQAKIPFGIIIHRVENELLREDTSSSEHSYERHKGKETAVYTVYKKIR